MIQHPSQSTLPMKRPKPQVRMVTSRVVIALMLREMSTTYGRSHLGYLWAVLEPVAGILLMAVIFSFAFKAPPIGTNFALFFASGILPYSAYIELNGKISSAMSFSRQLLAYPRVTYLDAFFARILLNGLTLALNTTLIFLGIIFLFDVTVILDLPTIFLAFSLAVYLATGIGVLNAYLLKAFTIWPRIWAIITRPLFLVSCIFFLFDIIPRPYQDWLWWNPLIHIVGLARRGIYATYDADYVSLTYVVGLSSVCLVVGILLLKRHHRDLLNL